MNNNDILSQVANIFRDQFLQDDLEIQMKSTPNDIEAWDSLAHIGIMIAVGTHFGVDISPEEIAEVESVSDIVSLVIGKLR